MLMPIWYGSDIQVSDMEKQDFFINNCFSDLKISFIHDWSVNSKNFTISEDIFHNLTTLC